ncbi:MAG: hypothetical protein MUC96_18465 [Myxococcaceae bacterium]|jgi:hypothetical protein|nr:hypothetical protein [Myxococcaceae bacterium]
MEPQPDGVATHPNVFRILRADRFLLAGVCLLSVAVLAPLAQTPILPLNDLPNHVAMSALLRHMWSGDAVAAFHFELQPHPAPYWLTYLLLLAASYLFPTLTGAKVVVALCLLSVPLSTMRLLLALRRSPRLALWSFALCWDFSLSMGFIAYTLSVSLGFVFLARCIESLDAKPRRSSLLVTVLLGLLLAQSHAHAAGGAAVLVFAVAVLEFRRRWVLLRGLALSAVPVLGLVPWILLGARSEGRARPETIGHWPDVGERMSRMFHYTVDLVNGQTERNVLGLAFVFLLLAPLVLAAWTGGDGNSARPRALYLAAWALYVVMPASLVWPFFQLLIHERHATMILLLGLALPAASFTGRQAWRLIPGGVVALAVAAVITVQCARFSTEVQPFLAVVDAVPPSSRIAWVLWQQRTPESVRDTIPQVPAYLLAEKGGYSPYLFQTPNLPLRYRADRHRPHPHWHHPDQFTLAQHGIHYDYVLVQGKQLDRFQQGLIEAPEGRFRASVVLESGIWRLYQMRREP